jgi:hypothetical protein
MPCHSDYPSDEQIQFAKEKNELKEELDKVTRLLCATLRCLETEHDKILKSNLQFYSHPYLPDKYLQIEGLEAWWNEHKKKDELRLIRELVK